ncbi:hypothetical protein FHN55_12810 [Streptomyces sp. NP160]|uniref:hypothetical protein n=1 Tax=Streptomyces sp. NP160 TaxID=2586637 RepID=UPI0011187DB0|nr:hypothetical protein [Streptomyces sp. NP160]TNM64431.1 hypothetical protein FHN55_12810 [Streptomyces sp. NP160]
MSAAPDRPAVDRERLAASAAAALGLSRVDLGEELGGSSRSFVVRGRADGRPVVLKLPLTDPEAAAREEAALRLATERGAPGVVPLLGVGEDPPVLVLEDLGSAATLADRLLGDDPASATDALVAWGSAVGRLQAATCEARPAFEAALAEASPFGAPDVDGVRDAVAGAVAVLRREAPRVHVRAGLDDAAADELAALVEHLERADAPRGLVPGDTCPDNALLVAPGDGAPDGVRLLDFEGAAHRHVAWEAAYLALPWPSCWCSWRLPDHAVEAGLAAWREAVAPAVPASCSAADLAADVDAAVVAWTAVSAAWFLPSAVDGDHGTADPARDHVVPRRRALLQHRTRVAAERAAAGGAWPALADWCGRLHEAAVGAWGERPLDLAPAYR